MPQLRRLLIMAALKDVFSKARRKKEISPFTVKKKHKFMHKIVVSYNDTSKFLV